MTAATFSSFFRPSSPPLSEFYVYCLSANLSVFFDPSPSVQTSYMEAPIGMLYREFHQLADLKWVELDSDFPSYCPVVQPLLPKFHLPKQNRADSGISKIKVNLTKVCELMEHPVDITMINYSKRPSSFA